MSTPRERRLQEIIETLAGFRGADGDRAARLSDLQTLQTKIGGVRQETRKIISESVGGGLSSVQQLAQEASDKADQALADITAEIAERIALGEDLTASISQQADDLRVEFAAADVVISQDVVSVAARVDDAEAVIQDNASIRETEDALLAGRLERLEANIGAQNLIETPIFAAGDPQGAWSDPATSGYGAITSLGHFATFSFTDELQQDDHDIIHTAVAGAFGETSMRFSGLVYVPATSTFSARVGFLAEDAGGVVTEHVQVVAVPGDPAARFSVEFDLAPGVVSVRPLLLSGLAADSGVAGHEVFWQDLRAYDVTLVNAAVSSEATVRAQKDEALGVRIDSVEAEVGANFATLINDYLTAADTNSAIALSRSELKAEIENPSGDSVGANLTANYLTAVQTNAAIATATLDLEATFTGALYAITDPLLGVLGSAGWQRTSPAQGTFSRVDNERHPTGSTWAFTVALGQQDGLRTDSTSAQWVGPENADAYVVEVEFTLTSGALTGAGIALEWRNTGAQSFIGRASLSGALVGAFSLNAPMRAQVVIPRPAGYGGSIERNVLSVFANQTAFGDAAKSIRFHMVTIRPATAEEQGEGAVGAKFAATLDQDYLTAADTESAITSATTNLRAEIENPNGTSLGATVQTQAAALAEIDGYLAATYSFAVRAGSSGARLDLVATNDPGGGTSVARIEAEFIILSGTVTSPLIAADSILARHVVVGDGGNLVPDDQMQDPGTWIDGSTGDWGLYPTPAWTGFRTKGMAVLPGPMNSGGKTLFGKKFPVRAGEEYVFRVQRQASGAVSSNARVQFFDYAGAALAIDFANEVINIDAAASTTWANRDFEKSVTVPSGAIQARMTAHVASSDAVVRIAGFEFRPKIGTVDIRNGSITGDLLTVDQAVIDKLFGSTAFIDNLVVGESVTILPGAVGHGDLGLGAAAKIYESYDGVFDEIYSGTATVFHSFTVQHAGLALFQMRLDTTRAGEDSGEFRVKVDGTVRDIWQQWMSDAHINDNWALRGFIPVSAGSLVEFDIREVNGEFGFDSSSVTMLIFQRLG